MSRSLRKLVRHALVFRGNRAAAVVAAPSKGGFSSPVSRTELPWPLRSRSQRCFSSGGWLHRSPVLMSAASKSGSSSLSDPSVEHATGLEREELEAELRGEHRFDMEPPRGPFGTKDAPAIIPSAFDERIVGCSGGVGEDEHDVVWFKLRKGQNHECVVCTQVFQLKTIGEGGKPGGHH